MKSLRILAPSLLAFAFVSCASQKKADSYDTTNPYGAADTGQAGPVNEPVNPVYDTPAAYEESSVAPTSSSAVMQAPSSSAPTSGPAMASNGSAIIHTVVAGDTLSGISSKYKVPSATIKQANNMTNDVVVLGKKMVIPPVR